MITQKIRILNNTSTSVLFKLAGLFSNLELNSLSTVPAWITENLISGYILSIDLDPTDLGTYYIYYTLGGSPPTEDALLIIEVVDSLTNDLDTCVKSITSVSDSYTNDNGRVKITVQVDFTSYVPKVNEYVYVSGSIYSGYHRIYNTDFGSITLDLPYISFAGSTDLIYFFGSNTSKCLVWINREGGRSSYTFDQRKDFNEIIGESKTFDNNGSIKYINRGKNFDYITVYKTGISNTEVDLIESLRYSIQAWEFDVNTNTAIPIVLDSNSFSKYNTKNRMNEINLKYRIATYKLIQNQ
jgi:hypothetical protein